MSDARTGPLVALLAVHRSADPREAGHRDRILELLGSSARPFDRSGFTPGHVTASGFVVDPGRRRLLLIHHRRLGIWIQPGGHVDPADPDPEAAARREIAEETGLTVLEALEPQPIDVDVHAYPARAGEPAHLHFDVRFAFRAADARLRPNDEVREARWVGFGDLATLGADRSILRPAGKLLRAP